MRTALAFASTALLAAPLLWAAPAHATLISLGLQETGYNSGNVTTVMTDTLTPGGLSYSGTYGSFTLNQIQAVGAPAIPAPNFDSSSINVSSAAGGTLFVLITEQGLSAPVSAISLLSAFTSNIFNGSATSVVETTFSSATDALYGGQQLATATFGAIGTSTSTNSAPTSTNFSETVEYMITTTGSSDVNDTIDLSGTIPTPVPEPGTMALVGTFLIGLGLLRRRWTV